MAIFDQRGQQVTTQYNINFDAVQSPVDLVAELKKVQAELARLTEEGALAENGIDAKSSVEKAVLEAQKPVPDKKKLVDYLAQAKTAIEGVAAVAGLVAALTKAVELAQALF